MFKERCSRYTGEMRPVIFVNAYFVLKHKMAGRIGKTYERGPEGRRREKE